MPCFVPDKYKHLKWHVIRSLWGCKNLEIAEWVNDKNNGPIDKGHWVRWGRCGDFPSLCCADYIGPFPDQEMLEPKKETWLEKWIG